MRNIVLDKGWYRPGFMCNDGTLAGLGYTIASIGDLQKRLVSLNWQVSAADQAAWDAVWGALQGKAVPGTSTAFTGWGWTRDELVRKASRLLVTESSTPDDALVAEAALFANDVDAMVAYYKRVTPESSGAVESAKAEINQKLAQIGPLQDPGDVAWQTFQDEIRNRAGGLGLGLGTLALALGVLFILTR